MHTPVSPLNKITPAHLHPPIGDEAYPNQQRANTRQKYQVITYGQCDECGCPAFAGEGTFCTRASCGHHWKSHKAG